MHAYLGPKWLSNGKELDTMFRISRARFQRLMEDIAVEGVGFYLNTVDGAGKQGSSFKASSLSKLWPTAMLIICCLINFKCLRPRREHVVSLLTEQSSQFMKNHENEYICLPTPDDIKSIKKLHGFIRLHA
jgi:hypothetical protein